MDDSSKKAYSQSLKKKSKLNNWISSSFDSAFSFEESKTNCRKRKHLTQIGDEHFNDKTFHEVWLEKYAPKVVEELSVHKKKILEVESWITQNSTTKKGGAPILLLSGPSGCGKTTTLVVVAQKHNIQVEEWINPLTTPFNVTKQAGLHYQSETTCFEEFLFRSGKYTSVLSSQGPHEQPSTSCNKLILLDDFPNFLYRDPSLINNLLRKYQRTQRWPLVLIISNGADTDGIKRQLRSSPIQLATINFNPVSASLMSKTLNRICSAEGRIVSKDDITMMSSTGDIRSAINCLQFSSQFENMKISKRSKKSVKPTSSIAAKDTTMILFRALGKIFYCKRVKITSRLMKQNNKYRDPLVLPPEDVLDQCCLSGSAFSLFLHHNYLNFFDNNPFDDVTSAAECLSLADTVNSPLTLSDPTSGGSVYTDRYEGILSARGMIFSNSLRATSEMCSSVSGTWRPMHKPSWFEVRRTAQENNLTAHELFWRQKEDLPLLVHLSSRFETPQRNFIKEVIAIPKWKSFRSFGNRLGEQETTDEELKIDETSSGENVDVKVNVDDDDDVTIEEFSD